VDQGPGMGGQAPVCTHVSTDEDGASQGVLFEEAQHLGRGRRRSRRRSRWTGAGRRRRRRRRPARNDKGGIPELDPLAAVVTKTFGMGLDSP